MKIESYKPFTKTNLLKRTKDGNVNITGDIPTPYGLVEVKVYRFFRDHKEQRELHIRWGTDVRQYRLFRSTRICGDSIKDMPLTFGGLRKLAFEFVMQIHLEGK